MEAVNTLYHSGMQTIFLIKVPPDCLTVTTVMGIIKTYIASIENRDMEHSYNALDNQ